jgi:hypothetical protein
MELDPGIRIVMHSVWSLKTGCDRGEVTICMELDPGIHIVMHSVWSLKTGCDTDTHGSM